MTTEQLTTFFGYGTLINYGILLFSTLMILGLESPVTRIHGNMFGISKDKLREIYFYYLAVYKLLTIIFFLVPYLVFKFFM